MSTGVSGRRHDAAGGASAPYSALAAVYDRWMAADRVPYSQYLSFIRQRFAHAGRPVHDVLDVGCGTGVTLGALQDAGYHVVGVDPSPQMVALARQRVAPDTVLRTIGLPDPRVARLGPFDAAVMCFDVGNYLTGPGELAVALRQVALALRPGGVVVFDLSTRPAFEELLAAGEFTATAGAVAYRWRTTRPCDGPEHYEFAVTLPGPDGPRTERHRQRWFDREHVRAALVEAGFTGSAVHEDYTDRPAGADSRRETWSAITDRGEPRDEHV